MTSTPRCLPHLVTSALLSWSAASAQTAQAAAPPVTPGRLLVADYLTDSLLRFSAADGRPRRAVHGISGPNGLVLGPDGLVYACASSADEIVRVDPRTLALVDVFVGDDPSTPADEAGGLDTPAGLCFGADGNVYVASFETDSVLRYDGASGAFLDVFVRPHSGTLDGPDSGILFGPDGALYVPSFWNDRVLRYDGISGASLGTFVTFHSGGLDAPRGMVFHQGQLYVCSSNSGKILRYDAAGAFVDAFAAINQPHGLAFDPDDGQLYVVSPFPNQVSVFDGLTGAFRKTLVPSTSALTSSISLVFVP